MLLQAKTHLAQHLAQALRISPDLEAKNGLLKNNHTLYQLYKDLVTTSIISADEFWAHQARGKLLSDQVDISTPQNMQEGGLPSAFLVRTYILSVDREILSISSLCVNSVFV